MLARIEEYLKSRLGFDVVMDTTFARHLSLDEQAREFYERKSPSGSSRGSPSLPMLASACPGWICYAEKTHGELLPLISRTRSPQQIAGLLAKRYVIESKGEPSATRIYHMTVMPCYDKKLEASRQDFFDEITNSRDVDLVITTGELDDMMRVDGFEVAPLGAEMDEDPLTPPTSESGATTERQIPSLLQQPGSSSGSYLFDLIRRVWLHHLSQTKQTKAPSSSGPCLTIKTIRSADYTEYILRSSTEDGGQILFKGAQCYGFRNLQNLVRKVQKQTGIKSKKASAAIVGGEGGLALLGRRGGKAAGRGGMVKRGGKGQMVAQMSQQEEEDNRGYDFVEVMACPGGCVNGGGQIRPPGGLPEASTSSSLTTRTITTDVTEAVVEGGSSVDKEADSKMRPQDHIDGWLTPAASSASGDVEMLNGVIEEAEMAGWKGTTKEWVKRVETAYWSNNKEASDVTSVHQGQALGQSRDVINHSISATLSKLVLQTPVDSAAHLDVLAEKVVEELCNSRVKGEERGTLLRTQYRAIQDEAVSGLAVQW
jgi:iron only hydrogenase large subunit-like protein